MKCPYCDAPLLAYSVPSRIRDLRAGNLCDEAVVLDHCDCCKAVWFDRGEISTVSGFNLSQFRFEGKKRLVQRKCRKCGAVNSTHGTDCEYCGANLFIHCPRCNGRLCRTSLLNFPLDTCFDCGGLWISDNVYEALSAALTAPFGHGMLVCVACGKSGLTERNTMLSEIGPVCDTCGLARERREMARFEHPDAERNDNPNFDELLSQAYRAIFRI